jgi:hypothetical protein
MFIANYFRISSSYNGINVIFIFTIVVDVIEVGLFKRRQEYEDELPSLPLSVMSASGFVIHQGTNSKGQQTSKKKAKGWHLYS